MASITYLDGQTPVWRTPSGTQSITIDANNQNITVENTTLPKKIIINPNELSNGTQVLPYTQLYEKINAVNASVYPAPDSTTIKVNERVLLDGGVGYTNSVGSQEILMSDGTNEGHYRADFVEQINTSTGNYWSNNTDTLQVNNTSTPSYINCSPYNGFLIQNDVKGGTPSSLAQLTHTQLQILDPNFSSIKTAITSGDITLTDSGNVLTSNLTTDYIRFGNNTNTEVAEIGQSQFNLTDKDYYFQAPAHPQMFKCLNIGLGYNITQAPNGYNIMKTDNFVFVDSGVSLVVLQPPSTYLDQQNGEPGWTCVISNINGSDIDVDCSGEQWYSHFSGTGSGVFHLKKYATASFTLIYSPNTGSYWWAISMY